MLFELFRGFYISIPQNYALEAVSFWTEKHIDSLHCLFSIKFELESIQRILEKNNCTF